MHVLDVNKNFLALEDNYSNYNDSEIVIVSAPYEHTVSYGGGTKNGPDGILKASQYVEFFDDELFKELCFEKKIATLEKIDFSNAKDKDALDLIYNMTKALLNDNKFVVTLGGEHTISAAPIKAHFEKYPNMCILQFDAHSDFRDSYNGSIYSHASVMARVAEFFPPDKITQLGIRAQCIEEAEFIKNKNVNTFYASAVRRGLHSHNWIEKLVDSLDEEIYITFDVDYFDPSIMPTTGTPEPDGFLYSETLDVFRKIREKGKKIIGFDVVELAPINGITHPDITCARLIYKILNYAFY